MKNNPFLQICSISVFALMATVTTIQTTAQTALKPIYSITDTTHTATPKASFEVQIIPDNTNGEKFVLNVNNPLGERLKIVISSFAGIGFSDQTKELNYRKRISMQGAEDGKYTITVSNDKRTFVKTITLQTTTEINRNLSLK